VTPEEAHSALLETLDELRRTLPTTKDAWDMDAVVRLAVERLWITAGNTAEEYRRTAGIDLGVEPWSELVAYRNRLALPSPEIFLPTASGSTRRRTSIGSSLTSDILEPDPERSSTAAFAMTCSAVSGAG
jgi:hypothetical protein